jgi:hypothetical protein
MSSTESSVEVTTCCLYCCCCSIAMAGTDATLVKTEPLQLEDIVAGQAPSTVPTSPRFRSHSTQQLYMPALPLPLLVHTHAMNALTSTTPARPNTPTHTAWGHTMTPHPRAHHSPWHTATSRLTILTRCLMPQQHVSLQACPALVRLPLYTGSCRCSSTRSQYRIVENQLHRPYATLSSSTILKI